MTTTILQPGEIEAAASAIPELRLPHSGLFADRARRLDQLAEGHALGEWLRFLAAAARAQHDAGVQLGDLPKPDVALLARCREHAMPPLAPSGRRRDGVWHGLLRGIAGALADTAPPSARAAMGALQQAPAAWLEDQAERVLAGRREGLDLAAAPLVGAALQTYWTGMAGGLNVHDVGYGEHRGLCPVCGSPPVSSLVRIGGAESGLRYLHCALCASEWHVVRAKCSNCDNTKDLVYYTVEGADGVVRAEACPQCRTYLKVIGMEKDPRADAVADDLATLALDILLGEEGYAKSGMNLLLVGVGD
jgi:FdhE protein